MTTFARLHRVLTEDVATGRKLRPERITAEATFDDLGLDSLDRVELLMGAEEAFGITISDDEAERCRSVADLVTLVERLVGTAVAA